MSHKHSDDCSTCDYNNETRPKWGDGEWVNEPNRIEFEHAGLPCILHRGPTGSWCGYAAVPPGHPLHKLSYNDVYEKEIDISVHGGLTFSGKCHGCVCHVPKPGEPDDVWWFGFDCAHAFDMSPYMTQYSFGRESHYWNVEEVRKETETLAEQLANIKEKI